MKLLRLRIEQLRQFRQPLEIDDLAPGLNIFHGPNESGKSTLVRAIRAAFFERHRSSSVDDLRPWGDSAAAPCVELEFESQGAHWHLIKSFLQRKRCDLRVDNQSYSGEEAEEKLADLLGFQFPGRGASQEKHWGIPGLLWVEQGSGQDVHDAVEHAGDHLKSALNSLLGEVASSGGDDVIQEVKALRGELLTPGGKPTGDYAGLGKQQQALQAELEALEGRIGNYQTQVDRLGELRRQHQEDEREKPWEAVRQEHQAAQRRYQELETLRQEQQREQDALEACRQNLALLRQQRKQAQDQSAKLEQRRRAFELAGSALQELEARSKQLKEAQERAEADYKHAKAAVQQARQFAERERLQQDIAALDQQLQTLSETLAKARAYQGEIGELRDQGQEKVEPAALKQLKKTQRELNDHTIRSQTIATRLQYDLETDRSLQLNGQTLTTRGEELLLEEATLEIPGVGRLRITPGGEDLGKLRRELARLEEAYRSQLQALKVTSLDEAEQRASRQAERAASLERLEALLDSIAPKGVDPLGSQHAADTRRLEQYREALAALPKPKGEPVSLATAEAALESAETCLSDAEHSFQKHQRDLVAASQHKDGAQRELRDLQDELESPEHRTRQQALQEQIIEAGDKAERLEAAVLKRQARIDEARPDLLEQDVQRLAASAEQLEAAYRNREIELTGLQSRLESQGAEGLEEQRDALASKLEHISRRHEELRRRAEALELLLSLLQGKREALTRRLQAPLQKHLNHYLAVLFPHASLEVDDKLIPGQLTRSGPKGQEIGDVQALSFGAREQMGLISRLAYADLLREAGRPTLIILDDTLVHSDRQRLAQMKRILFDAGQRHQILLFTCHPENWQDAGVAPRDLEALKMAVGS